MEDTPKMTEADLHAVQDNLDADLQAEVAKRMMKAEEDGNLMGMEAPVYRCHTFIPTKAGLAYARSITNQLNHLADALGVIGFQVDYCESSFSGDSREPDSGYFQIRVFANYPEQSE